MLSFGIFIIKFVFLKQNYICLFLWLPFIVCFKFGNVVWVFLNFVSQCGLLYTPYCWLLYIYYSFPIHFLFDCRHLSIEHVRDHILLVWKILPSPSFFKTLTFKFSKLWNRENPMMQKLSLCEKNTIKGLQLLKGRCVFHEFLFLFMIQLSWTAES